MGTILDSLKAISGYPIPASVIQTIALARSLDLTKEATAEELTSATYRLTKADLQRWVSFAPNISQGGASFDILYSDRERLREEANAVYGEFKDPLYQSQTKVRYGYKGSQL